MKKIIPTKQFKKDLKRYANKPQVVQVLQDVIKRLENDIPLSPNLKAHPLTGDYAGYLECHLKSDVLLIWLDEHEVYLTRLGSHAELFGKGRKR